ncbi:MAG: hypothetical protein Kow0059_13760 [Candidatus Sumerlaeia bacterium]
MKWIAGGRTIDLADDGTRPLIMGVLNVTPDSFSDGGRLASAQAAVEAGRRMLDEGADIVDVGGESTRPGATPVDVEEEWRRVGPVLAGLRRAAPGALISIDTYKGEAARRALAEGADIVNDISAGRLDPALWDVVAGARCGYVLMHMQGEPGTMQQAPHYEDCVREVGGFLADKLAELAALGVEPERVVADPGIGFGKRLEDNLALLANLNALGRAAGRPLLVGPSRKRFIGDALGLPVEERLEGTLAAVALAVWQGAAVVRVHDVRAARRAADLAAAIRGARCGTGGG